MGLLKFFLVLFFSLAILGCSYDTGSYKTNQKTLKLYKVQRGETLYSIAWRYNLDYRQLSYWNKIPTPYRIYPGQRIYLNAPPGRSYYPPQQTATAKPPKRPVTPQRAPVPRLPRDIPEIRLPTAPQNPSPSKPQKSKSEWVASKYILWQWPTKGRVVRRFSQSQSGKQGVDIMGTPGQSVLASASGKVVYSGNGLKGYGELVIIKHNATFLSAYAHNRKRTVREGAIVRAGQKIAELGGTGASTPMLHFEIRENGRPVDPLKYLPKTGR